MKGTIYWLDKQRNVQSENDISTVVSDVLIDSINLNVPLATELIVGENGLMVSVGESRSVAMFASGKHNFTYSLTTESKNPTYEFSYGGSLTEIDNNRTISFQRAFQALIEFLSNGERPPSIPWE